MNKIQIFLLMQNQVMVLTRGMTITSPKKLAWAKNTFKEMMGLPKNAPDLRVLQAIGELYEDNGIGKEFNEYMAKKGMNEKYGIRVVDESPLAELN